MLFAGALVKYIPLILIPPLLYKIWSDKNLTLKDKTVKTFAGLFLGAIFSFLLYLPFFEGSKNIAALLVGLRNQYNFDIVSRGVFTSFILYKIGLYGVYLRVFSLLSAVIISIYLVYKKKLVESVYITLMIPVFFGNLWFQPWYLLWSYFLLAKKELSYGLLFLTIFLELIIINSNVLRTSTYVFALFIYVMSAKYLLKFVRNRRLTNAHV
jgi:NADH:ubiquinone oxidoreductase subunit K